MTSPTQHPDNGVPAESRGFSFAGRTVLVTGASRGIGRATALQLGAAGGRVALLARSLRDLTSTAEIIRSRGGVAEVIPADLSEPAQIPGALRRAEDALGPIELLINNAAVIWPFKPSAELDISEWAAAVAINLTSAAALSFAALPGMLQLGTGRILNVGSPSVANPTALLRANAYVASKAGLEAHTVNLAAELAGTGVLVNAFRPGSVETPMQEWIRHQDPADVGAELHEFFIRHHAEGAAITADETARVLLARMAGPGSGQIWDFADPL